MHLQETLEKHKAWATGEDGGERANLNRANLNRANLSGADLSGANLSGADLSWANLSGANLSGANLSGADLNMANLSWADLSRANLSGANLSGADLRWAILPQGLIRFQSKYEATLYPDGRFAYGCEIHTVKEWPGLVDALCAQHEPENQEEHKGIILALLGLAVKS